MEFVGDALPLSRDGVVAAADLVGGEVNALWAMITVPSRQAPADPLRAAHFQCSHQPSLRRIAS